VLFVFGQDVLNHPALQDIIALDDLSNFRSTEVCHEDVGSIGTKVCEVQQEFGKHLPFNISLCEMAVQNETHVQKAVLLIFEHGAGECPKGNHFEHGTALSETVWPAEPRQNVLF
jgi:hypothetical protein